MPNKYGNKVSTNETGRRPKRQMIEAATAAAAAGAAPGLARGPQETNAAQDRREAKRAKDRMGNPALLGKMLDSAMQKRALKKAATK